MEIEQWKGDQSNSALWRVFDAPHDALFSCNSSALVYCFTFYKLVPPAPDVRLVQRCIASRPKENGLIEDLVVS